MNIYSYLSKYNCFNKNENLLVRKSNTLNLSKERYNKEKIERINDILKYISPKKIFNPNNSTTNLKNFSKNLILNRNKNLFTKNSSKSYNFFSFDDKSSDIENINESLNNTICKYKNKYICNNYNKVFSNKYNYKENFKLCYSHKLSKQEKIMEEIKKLKYSFDENKKNSFIDPDCRNKNYHNILRSNYIWNKYKYNINTSYYLNKLNK